MNLSLRELVSRIHSDGRELTLLGIGPMSELVILSTLELGRDMGFPVIFIASRNQIDSAELGGGYVMGWDQFAFSEHIKDACRKVGFNGLLYLCRDHGGPWQRDNERYEKLPEDEAMKRAKQSYLDDLKAGFNVLHIDPTKDPNITGPVPMEIVISRTIELIEYNEEQINKLGLGQVSYEVGTEEIAGGITSSDAFERFISELLSELDRRHLPHPALIVGQTGTLVKMNRNVGNFNADITRELCDIAKKYGIGFKEHNADYLPDDIIKLHPKLGVTAANVAPEFGLVETLSLVELAKKEEQACIAKGDTKASNFVQTIQKLALESGRWKKWLTKEEEHLTEKDIMSMPSKLEEITAVCGHYVFDNIELRKARETLYRNAELLGISSSPERDVINSIKQAILRYIDAFNLAGFNETFWKVEEQ